jgi:hypothetical protein
MSSALSGKNVPSAAIYVSRPSIVKARLGLRAKILESLRGSRARGVVDQIEQYYTELESNNSIAGVLNVFPAPFHQFLQANPGLKMIYDELSYLTFSAFCQIEKRGMDHQDFGNLTNMIGELLYAGTANERSAAQKLLNKNTIKYLIAPQEKLEEIQTFANSTCFLQIPLSEGDYEFLGKQNVKRPEANSSVMFNIDKALYVQHNLSIHNATGSANSNANVINALRNLDINMLTPELVAEINRLSGK